MEDRLLQGSGVLISETDLVTPLTEADIRRAGEAVLMAIGTSVSLGHVSPNGLMDYVARPDQDTDPIGAVVWDAFSATRIGNREATDNLMRFAGQRGLLEAVAEAAAS